MPPKPTPLFKQTKIESKPADALKQEHDARAMPPPPNPPKGILVPEVEALSSTLRNIAVKTGQVYAFFADSRRLGIQHVAPVPPQSLTESLGREVEKYDQLCDAVESRLLRAISVLQRDIARRKRRQEEEEAAAAAAATKDVKMEDGSHSAPLSPATSTLPAVESTTLESSPPPTDPSQSPPLSGSLLGRRPSAISISSLQRPALPLKLDLSSAALRISPEEASLFSQGLSSPVTLAPKSARPYGPNELPPELMAVLTSNADAGPSSRVEIDLTGPDTVPDVDMSAIGNSADKPIDLDAMELDMATMTELFGDETSSTGGGSAVDGLFTPVIPGPEVHLDVKIKHEDVEESFLSALSSNPHEDIFTSLPSDSQASVALPDPSVSAPLDLASFSQMNESAVGAGTGPEGSSSYDLGLDLSFLAEGHNTEISFDMEALLGNMGDGSAGSTAETKMEEP
ncbi:hypothetical protein MIND_00436200 [Mycena indigotica]|uniref:Uncharacterized protein n=1 Tax=Mycena indigotica TaxID=2126181 RepID=A0A8H6SWK1_9AGAR|nr:uncharacterized protein MIND_00436200 [Mycena indigotica]KAF7306450.1 hypothetical protein MIND_00436200 [Mycena indigotica]